MKAIWNNTLIAQSNDNDIVTVEGNAYFPVGSIVDQSLLHPSDTTSFCPWKGTANYFSLVVDGQKNHDAVWYYKEPSEAAKNIKDRVAFWKGVNIVSDD